MDPAALNSECNGMVNDMTSEAQYLQRKRGWTKPSPADVAAKLTMVDDLGEVAKEWLLKQGKFVLGSGSDCNIRLNVPGITDQNVLLVIGSRQMYLRALATNMTQDHIPRNEIIVEAHKAAFEVAGQRFLIAPQSSHSEQRRISENLPKARMQFTMARPEELARNRDVPSSLFRPAESFATPVRSPEDISSDEPVDAAWIANLVQSAIEPLEHQIQNALHSPEFRSQRRSRRSVTSNALEAVFGGKTSEAELVVPVDEMPKKLEELSDKQNSALTRLGEQIADITSQLSEIETLVTAEREQQDIRAQKEAEDSFAQNQAIGQLQNGMVSVSEALRALEAKQDSVSQVEGQWRQEVQSQVSDLRNSVDTLVNSSEMERQARAQQEGELEQQESSWRNDVQNQIIGLRQSVEVLLENSSAHQIAFDNNEQVRAAEEANWRNDVQGQISELKDSISTLVETAATNSRDGDHDAQELSEEEKEWKKDVQTQFSLIRSALEQVAQRQVEYASAYNSFQPGVEEESQPREEDSATATRADLELAAAQTRHLQSDWAPAEDSLDGEVNDNATETVSDSPSFDEPAASNAFGETEEAAGWQNPIVALEGESVGQESHGFETEAETQANADGSEFNSPLTSEPGIVDDGIGNSSEPESRIEEERLEETQNSFAETGAFNSESADPSFDQAWSNPVEDESSEENDLHNLASEAESSVEPQYSGFTESAAATEEEEFFFDAAGPASEPVSPSSESSAEEPVSDEGFGSEETQLPDWWNSDSEETTSESESQNEFHYGNESQDEAPQTEEATSHSSLNSEMFSMEALTGGDADSESGRLDPARELSEKLAEFQQADAELQEEGAAVELDADQQSALHNRLDRLMPGLEGEITESAEEAGNQFRFEEYQPSVETGEADEENDGDADAFGDRLARFANNESPASSLGGLIEPEAAADVAAEQEVQEFQTLGGATEEAVLEDQLDAAEATEAGGGDDDSVEDYMRKLLARMRGVPEEEVSMPETPVAPTPSAPAATATPAGKLQTPAETTMPAATGAEEGEEPFDMDNYVPRVAAPEQVQNLAAMRELANSSARTAIHKSTRQRHLSGIVFKIIIAGVGFTVGGVLVAINGLNVNVGLIATVAAFLVALIWGYDAMVSIKPLIQNGLVLKPDANQQKDADD